MTDIFAIYMSPFIDKPHGEEVSPYSLCENINILKNTAGEIFSCCIRLKDLFTMPFKLPLAVIKTGSEVLGKAKASLEKKALEKIDKVMEEYITQGQDAMDKAKTTLAELTRWDSEQINDFLQASLAWASAEHDWAECRESIKELFATINVNGHTPELNDELIQQQETLKKLEQKREETFAELTKLNNHSNESIRLKTLDLVGGFLEKYLEIKSTVLLLSFAYAFPLENMTAIKGKTGLQLRLVVPDRKNPFVVFKPKDRPKTFNLEVCGYVEGAVAKTISILEKCFDIKPSTAEIYAQARLVGRRRVFVGVTFDVDSTQNYQRREGVDVTLETVGRGYLIFGLTAFGGYGLSCSWFTGMGSEKQIYALNKEWLKLGMIFGGTAACAGLAWIYGGEEVSEKFMAAIGGFMSSSHLLTTILPARIRKPFSVVTSAPGVKGGALDHQKQGWELTTGYRGITKITPEL